jgi:hypothetical protein
MSIASTLDPIIQSINTSPYLPQATREELADLLAQLEAALQQVPPEYAAQAQALAEATRTLVETANQEEPKALHLHTAVARLEEAAETLADITPDARQIAFNIVSLTQGGSA